MKYLLLLIINLFLLITLSAQPNFSNAYRVAEDSAFYTSFGSIIATDSAYYISGITRDTLDGYSINRGMLMKIDTNGNKIWSRIYGDITHTTETWYGTMIVTNQGNLANVGKDAYGGTGFLLITDYDGNILINKRYSDTNRIFFTGIVQDDNSNFYLSGNFFYTYDSKSILIKTDSLGNEIWRKYYDAFPNGDSTDATYSNDILIASNGNLILAVSKRKDYYYNFSYKKGVWIFEIDSTGDLLKEYHSPINNRWISVHSTAKTKDDGVLFCNHEGLRKIGTNPNIPSYDYEGYIGKLDSNLQLVWERRYGSVRSQFSYVKEKANGNILVTGSLVSDLTVDSVEITGWLMELDENGDSLWQREYMVFSGLGQLHVLGEFETLDDGRIVISGWVQNLRSDAGSAFNYWGWLIRTDSLGCIVPGCQLLDNTENVGQGHALALQMTVFPNPASDVVNFRFDKPINEKVVIRVYSSLGQLVGETNMNNSTEAEMNVSDWNSGMYFYGVYVEGRLVKQGQILIRN